MTRFAFRLAALLTAAALTVSCGVTLGGAPTPRPLRTPVPARSASPTPSLPPPAVATTTGYSALNIPTPKGTFFTHLIKERLAEVSVRTLTSSAECEHECAVMPLAQYVREQGAFAGMNGTYICPPDYAACANIVNSYDYAVYSSALRRWINPWRLSGQNGAITFNGAEAVAYRRSFVYMQTASRAPLTAGISMFPMLVLNGAVLDFEAEQTPAQAQRSMKGAIGIDGTHVYLALVANATLAETAAVLHAIGTRDALNLDGGGTSAMYIDGSYKVGPGRLLPNAIVLTRP